MNKRVSFFLLSLVPVALLTAGCQKDNGVRLPTKTELLSKSPWIFLSATASGTDVTNNPALACFKDNLITFAANGNFIVSEGAVICTPSTAGNFTWSFQTNETQLILSAALFPGGSGIFTLVSLNETNLVVSQNVTIPPSTTAIPVVFTFRH